MGRIFIFATIILSLSGCMMGPDYRRPAVDMAPSFRYESKEAAQTADTKWWKEFNDPVLEGLITEALVHNKGVLIAAANIERAAGVLTTTRSDLFPQINYTGTASRQHLSTTNAIPAIAQNPYNSFQVLGGASWEIDLWGRTRRLSEAARADVMASVEARRGVILSLVAEVANAYIQLLSIDEQLRIAGNTLNNFGESVKLFELQVQYGQTPQMTLEQARTQYETAAATIPQLEAQFARTENGLAILLGRNPGPVIRGKSLAELNLPSVPAGLPSQLLSRRPDVRQAEENLIAANARIGAARALYFPTISLTGNGGFMSDDLSRLFTGPSNAWSYAGSIVGPIFRAGAVFGQVKQAEAGQKAALFAYEQSIQNAFADTENALVARQKLGLQLKAEQRRVKAYSEYARLARLQYHGGYTPYLTVLSAEQNLFPAALNEVQTRAATLMAVVSIYKAMGGGWVGEGEKLARPKQD